MIQGTEKDDKCLPIWITVEASVAELGSSWFRVSMSRQQRKQRYVSVLLLRFALWKNFHRAERFLSVLINTVLTKRSLTVCHVKQIYMTNNWKRWQLNLHKTSASVLTESTSSLNFEKKKKYENIYLNKIRDMNLFYILFAKARDCFCRKKVIPERQCACSTCFRWSCHISSKD